MNPFRADLHTHTRYSDGTFSPEELIRKAKEIGLRGLSITDHDTINAYAEAVPLAQKEGILLGSGVEFSAEFEGMSVHLLGYDFELDNILIHELCKKHALRRKERNKAILTKLASRGIHLAEDELTGQGRPHIAALMVQKGYVSTLQEAFRVYIGEGKLCYASGQQFSVEETAQIVRSAGGKIFLAHPHLMEERKKVKKLLEFPFDGIECHYAKCSSDQEKKWIKLAQEKGWLMSGGSDFHGEAKLHNALGCSWVDETTFFAIFSRVKKLS